MVLSDEFSKTRQGYSSIFLLNLKHQRQGGNCLGVCEPLHVVSFRIGVGLKSSKPTEAQNKKAKRLRQISGTMAFAGLVFATASSIWSLGTWGLVGFSTRKINTSISGSVLLQDVTSWQRSTRGFGFLTY